MLAILEFEAPAVEWKMIPELPRRQQDSIEMDSPRLLDWRTIMNIMNECGHLLFVGASRLGWDHFALAFSGLNF